jgi:hypothetical protein
MRILLLLAGSDTLVDTKVLYPHHRGVTVKTVGKRIGGKMALTLLWLTHCQSCLEVRRA